MKGVYHLNKRIIIVLIILALLALGCMTVQANPGHVFRTATPTMTKTSTPTLIPTATATQTNTPTPTMPPIPGGWSVYQIPEYGVKFSYPAVFDKGFTDGYEGEVLCGITVDNNPKGAQFSMIIGIIRISVLQTGMKFDGYINSIISPMTEDWRIEKSDLHTKKEMKQSKFLTPIKLFPDGVLCHTYQTTIPLLKSNLMNNLSSIVRLIKSVIQIIGFMNKF